MATTKPTLATQGTSERPALAWNAGAWFGSQFGCTAWLLLLGIVLFARDPTAAGVAIGSFAVTNVAGITLWRRRTTWSFLAAIETLLFVLTIATATTVTVVNLRGVADPPRPSALVSTWLPWWTIAIPPVLMAWFFLFGKRMKPPTSGGQR